jgi:hypothetical protein
VGSAARRACDLPSPDAVAERLERAKARARRRTFTDEQRACIDGYDGPLIGGTKSA